MKKKIKQKLNIRKKVIRNSKIKKLSHSIFFILFENLFSSVCTCWKLQLKNFQISSARQKNK